MSAIEATANIHPPTARGAKREEAEFYSGKAPQEWLDAPAPLGTGARKPLLETTPCVIAVFENKHGVVNAGRRVKNYYAAQPVGIATIL